jgi:hypothetical protein
MHLITDTLTIIASYVDKKTLYNILQVNCNFNYNFYKYKSMMKPLLNYHIANIIEQYHDCSNYDLCFIKIMGYENHMCRRWSSMLRSRFQDSSSVYKDNVGNILDVSFQNSSDLYKEAVMNSIYEDDGYTMYSMRIRSERKPIIGDMFCSRHSQRGTIGTIGSIQDC